MNQQGCNTINTVSFTAMSAQVDACTSGAELQALATRLLNSIGAQTMALNQTIAVLTPLNVSPGNIGQVISFLTDLIAIITTPLTTATAQLPLLAAQVTTLTAAITAKAATLPGGPSITFPAYPLTTCV